jgi:hypothetical protein
MSVFWTATYLVNVGQPIIAQVEALNGIGYSTPSLDNSFAAVAIIVPTASPTLTRGSLTTESQAEISWSAVIAGSNGGSALTGYNIYWLISGSYALIATVGSTTLTYT